MATCEQLIARMDGVRSRLAVLEAHGQGHSQRAQDLLDTLDELQSQFDAQGCGGPPPEPLGHLKTTLVGGPVSVAQGETADLQLEITVSNMVNATSVEYSIQPPISGVGQVGIWSVPVPGGDSTQRATLRFVVDASLPTGPLELPVVENIYFGAIRDAAHQQYDYLAPSPTITVLAAPPPAPVPSPPLAWQSAVTYAINRDRAAAAWHAGRVNAAVPLSGGGVVAGTDSGGVWLIDAAGDALPVTDHLGRPSVACMVVGPRGEGQIFAGGDEGLIASDWTGVLPRATWRTISLPIGVASIREVVVEPVNGLLVIATRAGIHFAAIPASATGPWSWAPVAGLPAADFSGLAVGPQGTVVAAYWGNGTDFGIVVLNAARGQLAVNRSAHIDGIDVTKMTYTRLSSCEANRSRMYASPAGAGDGNRLLGVLRSDNGGLDWKIYGSKLTTSLPYPPDLLAAVGDQGNGWNNAIQASPVDPDIVVLGWRTSGPFLSTDKGASWQLLNADQNNPHLHSDVHRLPFDPHDPTGRRLYCCSDGGIAVSGDLTTSFTSQPNHRLANLQFTTIAASSVAPTIIAGALQDNGVLWAQAGGSDGWQRIVGGDGLRTAFLHSGQLLFTSRDYPAPHVVYWSPNHLSSRFDNVAVTVPKPGLLPATPAWSTCWTAAIRRPLAIFTTPRSRRLTGSALATRVDAVVGR